MTLATVDVFNVDLVLQPSDNSSVDTRSLLIAVDLPLFGVARLRDMSISGDCLSRSCDTLLLSSSRVELERVRLAVRGAEPLVIIGSLNATSSTFVRRVLSATSAFLPHFLSLVVFVRAFAFFPVAAFVAVAEVRPWRRLHVDRLLDRRLARAAEWCR